MKPLYYVYILSGVLSLVAIAVSAIAYLLGHLALCFTAMVLFGLFFTVYGFIGPSSKDEYRRKFVR